MVNLNHRGPILEKSSHKQSSINVYTQSRFVAARPAVSVAGSEVTGELSIHDPKVNRIVLSGCA
jgi:hypothetical protein